MTPLEQLADTLRSLIAAFESVDARWAVGGSLASTTYGEPRATNDIDVVAVLSVAEARRFASRLSPDFYADPDDASDAVREAGSFNVIDQRSYLKVDVFVPPPGPLGQGQLDRARVLQVAGGVVVPVLGPEDIVLQKLRWYELSGRQSDRQWRDVVGVLAGGGLDDGYLDEVAEAEALEDLLRRARRDIE